MRTDNIYNFKGVFVFAEQVDGKISEISFELLGKAKELAEKLRTDVTAMLLGYKVENLASELARYGADRVITVDDKKLESYMTEPYADAITKIIKRFNPEVVLYGATTIGRDLAPRVSARVFTGLTADCTKLDVDTENHQVLMTRPAFGGNLMATIMCPEYRPQMATVRPGVMQKAEPNDAHKAEVIKFDAELKNNSNYVEIADIIKKEAKRRDIGEANILVSGGRGVGSAENFAMLRELADILGGEVSASRACVDAGWVEKDLQVGQTGKTVRPTLYIAVGISGAIQHLAGMEESGTIIAINKDESAPIFEVADYGIVGDLNTIIPELIKKLRS
ncbi:MAG: electron transfer flavoprotein subunit alpha/FixB family protein [Clostridia bacterium]|nr:electron transfer flavoprotein subunit alpha/FixB family protein [Clostridia bacterium]